MNLTQDRPRALTLATAAILLLAGSLGPLRAEAAGVLVTYDVIGYDFAGPESSGPVTGGMVSILVPAATSTVFTTTMTAKLTKLTMTGPSGMFSLLGSWPMNVYPDVTGATTGLTFQFNGSMPGQLTTGGFLRNAVLTSIRITYFSAFGSGGSGIQGSASGDIGHFLGIGNEVRTVIPEPTSGLLLALGLVGVGGAAGCGRSFARRRIRRD